MALRLIRRHLKDCPQTSTTYRRCRCPIHVYGTLAGEKLRKALDQTSWEAASELITSWTASGEIGVVKVQAPTPREAVEELPRRLRSTEARLGGDAQVPPSARGPVPSLGRAQGHQQHSPRDRRWPAAVSSGLRPIVLSTRRRTSSGCGPSCGFATRPAGIKDNPAKAVKPPKVTQTPTLPFSRDEMKRIVAACDKFPGGNKERIKAFVLTMRYTGLRIGDAIRLSKSQVVDGKVFVRTAKTGQPVTVPVPAGGCRCTHQHRQRRRPVLLRVSAR